MFGREMKNVYYNNNINDDNINNISGFNLLHCELNPSKYIQNTNYHYFPILYGCINTRRGKVKYKNFQILSDNGCISVVVIKKLMQKLKNI